MSGLLDQVSMLFADPSYLRLDLLGKLLLAGLLGGLVGWEREASDKPAGLRTNLLICVGAALLGDVSIQWAFLDGAPDFVRADPARIAAQVVSGVGFLGAGTIIQARGSVTGLTTAATLWVVAAIGLAVGGGAYVAAAGTTILVLIALLPLGYVEERLEARRARPHIFRVVTEMGEEPVGGIEALLRERGFEARITRVRKEVAEERFVIFLEVREREDDVGEVRDLLIGRGEVLEVTRAGPTAS